MVDGAAVRDGRPATSKLVDRLRGVEPRTGVLDAETFAQHGLVGLAAVIPLQRATVVGAVGSVVSLVALLVIPLVLWAEWTRRDLRVRLTDTPLVFGVALLWWAGATYFWSVQPAVTAGNFFRLVPIVAMAIAFLCLSSNPHLRLRLLRAYVLGSVAASLLVIWQFLTTPAGARFSVSPDASINQVAFTLVLALVPAAYLLSRALPSSSEEPVGRRLWQLVAYGSAYSVVATAVLLSGSRSAVLLSMLATLAAGVLIVSGAASRLDIIKGFAAMLAFGVVLVSALSLADAPPFERLFGDESPGLRDPARAGLLIQAWTLSADRPILGAGLGTGVTLPVPGYSHQPRNPHNTHVQVFLELGAVGTILWALMLLTLLRAVWMRPPLERLMWSAQFAVLTVGIAARGFVFGVPMWFFLGVASALGARSGSAHGRRTGGWAMQRVNPHEPGGTLPPLPREETP